MGLVQPGTESGGGGGNGAAMGPEFGDGMPTLNPMQQQQGSPSPTLSSTTPAPLPSSLPPTPTPSMYMGSDPGAQPPPAAQPMTSPAPTALSALPPQPNQSVSLPSSQIAPMVSALQGGMQNQQGNPLAGGSSIAGGGFGQMTHL